MKHLDQIIKTILAVILVASFVLVPTAKISAHSGGSHDGKQVVGYFIEWGIYGSPAYLVKNIVTSGSADKLTVINYAFGNVAPDTSGQVVCKLTDEWADYQVPWSADQSVTGQEVTWPNPILGNFQQLKALKSLYPNLKVVISLGGWTLSKYFSDAALTPASRTAFVQSCVDLFIKGNLPDPGWGGMGGPGSAAGVFDGIDIDWEYPAAEGNPGNIVRPEDTRNFTLLMAEFRKQLNAIDPHLLLTAATSAGRDTYSLIELGKVARSINWFNLMTYDFHGPWENSTNFQSNLLTSRKDPSSPKYSVVDTVTGYLKTRVPAGKIVVGVPFYGHGWEGVTNVNHGLYQAATGPAAGTSEAGTENFNVLEGLIGASGFVRYWDTRTQAAWLFNAATSTFWTYDDAKTIAAKTKYICHEDLGGVMFWDLTGDDASGTLIQAIAKGLRDGCNGHPCK